MDQLSRDAKAAKAAGMSYGKWKGLQWEREQAVLAEARKASERERARKRAEREAAQTQEQAVEKFAVTGDEKKRVFRVTLRICPWCGKAFEGRGTQKYCSEACKNLKQQQNVREFKKRQREHRAAERAATGIRYDLLWKKCAQCGKAFQGTRAQTLCSDECRRARRKKQNREYAGRQAAKKVAKE